MPKEKLTKTLQSICVLYGSVHWGLAKEA